MTWQAKNYSFRHRTPLGRELFWVNGQKVVKFSRKKKPIFRLAETLYFQSTSMCLFLVVRAWEAVKAWPADQSVAAGGQPCFGRRPDRQLGHETNDRDHPNPNP